LSNSGTAEVLIPRSLCLIEDFDNLNIDVEDFCSVTITWEDGIVTELKPLKNKDKKAKNILLWKPNDIAKIEAIFSRGGNWILLIKSATNVLKGDNYVFVSPDLLQNKFIVKKGDVITSLILGESDLNIKSINLKIKSLLRETLDEIKFKGSQVSEINTSGNFIKKIKDFLQENQNVKFKLEVVSLRDSKTIEPIVVEINIFKIAS